MSVKDLLMGAAGSASVAYVDDVFSTWLYDGNGSTQTITNGIDLAGKGGMVWIKARNSGSFSHILSDTTNGPGNYLKTNSTDGLLFVSTLVTSFNSDGFSIGDQATINTSGNIHASWTFRKQPKFFDVMTYTGDGASSRSISHSLGVVPGMVVVKNTTTNSTTWKVWHRSLSGTSLLLNSDQLADSSSTPSGTRNNGYVSGTTSTDFTVTESNGVANVNANGDTYVAYLFAHDTAADGLIQCGIYTGTGSAGNDVSLGWEPQWVMVKSTSTSSNWKMYDSIRGVTTGNDEYLSPNTTGSASASNDEMEFNATGFRPVGTANPNGSGIPYIYIAIRRPNKPPTSGTQVFQPTVYTGTNVDNRLVDTTIAPDMVWVRKRNDSVLDGLVVGDRMRGQPYLLTGVGSAEVNDADSFDAQLVSAVEYGTAFSSMSGFWCGNDVASQLNATTTNNNQVAEAFKRAPGFFDIVCYAGTGVATTVSHGLGVAPELMLVKDRSSTNPWQVYYGQPSEYLVLNTSVAKVTGNTDRWNNTAPTSSVFSLGNSATVTKSGSNFVAYLFASLPGISKVGTYTGNGGSGGFSGTSQTINCGFSAGARFVLIKRTDNGGDWYVFDSARGIVAGSDPYLLLNASTAETSTVDVIDADSSGFIVNQTSGTNLNVTSSTYIYLAIA